MASNTGAMLGLNTYDEYGKPGSANLGRYQYTGQKWIGEAGLYDYKARDYLPHLGIFAQTDPIGYESGPNLYAYVGNDPINWIDPLGLDEWENCVGECLGVDPDIEIVGRRPQPGEIIVTGSRCPSAAYVCISPAGVPEVVAELNAIGQEVTITITGKKKKSSPVTTIVRGVGELLDDLADLIGPGERRRPGETTAECVARIAVLDPALAISGASGVAAGGAFLGYPGTTLSGGGGGTSLISSAARGSFGGQTMGGASFLGTGSLGGAIGRGLSIVSVASGAAMVGYAGGHASGAAQVCNR